MGAKKGNTFEASRRECPSRGRPGAMWATSSYILFCRELGGGGVRLKGVGGP